MKKNKSRIIPVILICIIFLLLNVPDYSRVLTATAPIIINKDHSIEVGKIRLNMERWE